VHAAKVRISPFATAHTKAVLLHRHRTPPKQTAPFISVDAERAKTAHSVTAHINRLNKPYILFSNPAEAGFFFKSVVVLKISNLSIALIPGIESNAHVGEGEDFVKAFHNHGAHDHILTRSEPTNTRS